MKSRKELGIEEKKIYAVKESFVIQEQFNEIMKRLQDIYIDNKEDAEKAEQLTFLKRTHLLFDFNKNGDYSAYASYDYKANDYPFDGQNKIVFNLYANTDYNTTIIHEIAHLITSRYASMYHWNSSGAHCLEFAIVCYCLQWRFSVSKTSRRPFFRAYDIHEDVAYPNLSINPSKFDSLIKLIVWNDIKDLVDQAVKLSVKIRKNLVV